LQSQESAEEENKLGISFFQAKPNKVRFAHFEALLPQATLASLTSFCFEKQKLYILLSFALI